MEKSVNGLDELACEKSKSFIEDIIEEELVTKQNRVHTRFPPEPNGYLHIGHAKAIALNFSLAKKYGGKCNLRMDDTNPAKEDMEYVESIMNDIKWLGYEWDGLYFASDYYRQLYDFACILIKKGLAYVDDLTAQQIKEYRGTLTEPGRNSPNRDRPIEENLDIFIRMRAGEFADGSLVLRAKIDMASPNINLRDPIIYRVLRETHYRTGDTWCIYPMYDFAHPLSDAIEGITHSICTMEFEDHRPLYDWFIKEVGLWEYPPRQIEFARLSLTRAVMSKRFLKKLVDDKLVSGWDDPRMPTLSGIRRRGYPSSAIRTFCDMIGVAKANSTVDAAMLEHCVRDELNSSAHRMMAVLDPVKVIIDTWPQDTFEDIELENLPSDKESGTRTMRFGRELFIEREDFMEVPLSKFFRLKPDGEVRLKNAYVVKCVDIVKDSDGNILEIHCTHDPDSKSGEGARKVKGTLHWVSAADAVCAKVRLYDYLLIPDEESEGKELIERFNTNSLKCVDALIEPALANCKPTERFQFMRVGYFCADYDHTTSAPLFNRIVSLKDSWSKASGK